MECLLRLEPYALSHLQIGKSLMSAKVNFYVYSIMAFSVI
jgi:hypothetical protein